MRLRIPKDKVTETAATVLSVCAAGLGLFLAPLLEDKNLAIKAVATVVSLVSLYWIFNLVRHHLSRMAHEDLLGVWYYVTIPDEGSVFKDGNFAAMEFSLDRNEDLTYDVTLYSSIGGLKRRGSERARGSATSKAIRYDPEQHTIDLVFQVEYFTPDGGNTTRRGRLFLKLTPSDHPTCKWELHGNWVSDLMRTDANGKPVRDISSGTMHAARPEAFLQLYGQDQA